MNTLTDKIVLHRIPAPEQENLTDYYTALAKSLPNATSLAAPERVGLYLLTASSGIQSSINFWRSALDIGPGLVSPAIFPWTLANGPASCLARLLQTKGPNITLVGDASCEAALLQLAETDLGSGRIDGGICLVVG